jgi:hypothetical protein
MLSLTALLRGAYLIPVPLTEGVSGDEPESEWDAASCGLARNHAPGRRPATPSFRHYERNVRTHQCHVEGHRSCATPGDVAKAGSEPKNRRGGAPRGEHPRRADCVSGSARDARRPWKRVYARLRRAMGACEPALLARRRVPLHPSACRRSASLFRGRERWQSSGAICLARRKTRVVCPGRMDH